MLRCAVAVGEFARDQGAVVQAVQFAKFPRRTGRILGLKATDVPSVTGYDDAAFFDILLSSDLGCSRVVRWPLSDDAWDAINAGPGRQTAIVVETPGGVLRMKSDRPTAFDPLNE